MINEKKLRHAVALFLQSEARCIQLPDGRTVDATDPLALEVCYHRADAMVDVIMAFDEESEPAGCLDECTTCAAPFIPRVSWPVHIHENGQRYRYCYSCVLGNLAPRDIDSRGG